MATDVAAWQLDIFGAASPVVIPPARPDPLSRSAVVERFHSRADG